jgi:molybdate transport system substrate-binding protein
MAVSGSLARCIALALVLGVAVVSAAAADVHVAVASNFAVPARRIAAAFEATTGHRAVLAFGSTGTFYAQVRYGAPFDALLAADSGTPEKLERDGLAVAGSRFTYAVGRLVLWSAREGLVDPRGDVLKGGAFRRLAIANPALAPYGKAAIETLESLHLLDALRPLFVQGENVAQTYQFVASGNAELGFVGLAQVMVDGRIASGSAWLVPAQLHRPIRQDAVLLARGRANDAATAWLRFLRSDAAQAVLRASGYEAAR